MPKQYGVKNFIHIANEYLNPDLSTEDGIEKYLTGWFCFQYNTTPNDDRLLDMTLEELLVLYQMHRIKEDPNYYASQTGNNDYEDWLKKEMAEEYATVEENIQQMEEHDREYTEKIRKQFPDVIETDFSMLHKKD
jgi:hypothetical protein